MTEDELIQSIVATAPPLSGKQIQIIQTLLANRGAK